MEIADVTVGVRFTSGNNGIVVAMIACYNSGKRPCGTTPRHRAPNIRIFIVKAMTVGQRDGCRTRHRTRGRVQGIAVDCDVMAAQLSTYRSGAHRIERGQIESVAIENIFRA